MSLNEYLKTIKKYQPLIKKEEKELFIKAKAGDAAAKDKIIKCNLRFVVFTAKHYSGFGLPIDDLIAEGNLGLLKAYEKFDHTAGFKFITYAVWWIKECILKALYENSFLVKLPSNKIAQLVKYLKKHEQDEYEVYDINEELPENYPVIINIDKPQVGDKTLSEILIDPNNAPHESPLEDIDLILNSGLLDNREKLSLYMYFGIGYDLTYNLSEIGNILGITRERVRQIKMKAIEKIKNNPQYINILREYLK